MTTTTKIVWTPWGDGIALGVYAPNKEDAECIFNICYNFGAVAKDAAFHSLKNDKDGFFGFFKTTWGDLKKVKSSGFAWALLPHTQKQIDATRENFFVKGFSNANQNRR
jgi:hypothetical protein